MYLQAHISATFAAILGHQHQNHSHMQDVTDLWITTSIIRNAYEHTTLIHVLQHVALIDCSNSGYYPYKFFFYLPLIGPGLELPKGIFRYWTILSYSGDSARSGMKKFGKSSPISSGLSLSNKQNNVDLSCSHMIL